jgi:hypothetical protein
MRDMAVSILLTACRLVSTSSSLGAHQIEPLASFERSLRRRSASPRQHFGAFLRLLPAHHRRLELPQSPFEPAEGFIQFVSVCHYRPWQSTRIPRIGPTLSTGPRRSKRNR